MKQRILIILFSLIVSAFTASLFGADLFLSVFLLASFYLMPFFEYMFIVRHELPSIQKLKRLIYTQEIIYRVLLFIGPAIVIGVFLDLQLAVALSFIFIVDGVITSYLITQKEKQPLE